MRHLERIGNKPRSSGVVPAMQRVTVTVIALVALSLAFASSATAKLCIQIDAPSSAHVRSPVVVRVTTLLPTWSGGRLVDLRPTSGGIRLRLVIRSADGAYREVRLRGSADAAVWKATLRFQRSGLWLLTVSGWESAPRSCAPPVRIRVKGAARFQRDGHSRRGGAPVGTRRVHTRPRRHA